VAKTSKYPTFGRLTIGWFRSILWLDGLFSHMDFSENNPGRECLKFAQSETMRSPE
jgi:hypothetical protein